MLVIRIREITDCRPLKSVILRACEEQFQKILTIRKNRTGIMCVPYLFIECSHGIAFTSLFQSEKDSVLIYLLSNLLMTFAKIHANYISKGIVWLPNIHISDL